MKIRMDARSRVGWAGVLKGPAKRSWKKSCWGPGSRHDRPASITSLWCTADVYTRRRAGGPNSVSHAANPGGAAGGANPDGGGSRSNDNNLALVQFRQCQSIKLSRISSWITEQFDILSPRVTRCHGYTGSKAIPNRLKFCSVCQ